MLAASINKIREKIICCQMTAVGLGRDVRSGPSLQAQATNLITVTYNNRRTWLNSADTVSVLKQLFDYVRIKAGCPRGVTSPLLSLYCCSYCNTHKAHKDLHTLQLWGKRISLAYRISITPSNVPQVYSSTIGSYGPDKITLTTTTQ